MMAAISILVLTLLFVFGLIAEIALVYGLVKKANLKSQQIENEKKRILYNTPFNMDDLDILDYIIKEEFTMYQIMNLAHRDDLYINPDMQADIITTVLNNVITKISPDLYDKLSLYYKKWHIDDIIFNKIKLLVINYTIEVNGNYKK